MRRSLLSPWFLSSALCLAPACKEPEGMQPNMAELAPDGAQLVIGFSLAPIQSSAIADLLGSAAKSDRDVAAMITSIEACKLDVSTLRATIAAPISETADDVFAVIESPGIGKKEALECLEEESAKALGEDAGNLMLRTHGPVRVAPMEGGGSIIQFNEDAIGLVDGPWEQPVLDRIEKADARTKTAATSALELAPTKSHVWLAAAIDDGMRQDLAGVDGVDALQYVTASIDIADDWAMKVGMYFSDAAKAKAFEGAVSAMKEDLAAGGTEVGIPETTMSTLAFEHADTAVHVSLTVPKADVIGLATMAGAAMQ